VSNLTRRTSRLSALFFSDLAFGFDSASSIGVVRKQKMRRAEDQIGRFAALAGVMLLAAAEALAQDKPAQSTRRIVVSIPDRKLAVLESGKVIRIFPTAVGAPKSPSPSGTFKIVQRLADPTWYPKGKIVPPGKTCPIGTRWLGLSVKGYGIHGTNNPASIGHNASHGCIRLRNRDVEELFGMVSVGDEVELAAERTPETQQIFGAPAAPVAAASAAPLQ
jgi:lipoprotein-anchoring transpeptidase ErfK/SrfK